MKRNMALGKSVELEYDRGDRVEHPKFGKGRVQQLLGSTGEDEKILVRLDSGDERILLASFLSNISRKDRLKTPSRGGARPKANRESDDEPQELSDEEKVKVQVEDESFD